MRSAREYALRYYERLGCIIFWNPRDLSDENLRTDTPDVEALYIEPGNVNSCEVYEGQYLVRDGVLQDYQPYPDHTGIDKVFAAMKRVRPGFFATAAIEQCVKMRWQIMDASMEPGIWFKPHKRVE